MWKYDLPRLGDSRLARTIIDHTLRRLMLLIHRSLPLPPQKIQIGILVLGDF
jgi:hypothetical protein